MKIEEILQIVDAVSKSALAEFKYEEGGVKLSLKKAAAQTTAAQAVTAQTVSAQAAAGDILAAGTAVTGPAAGASAVALPTSSSAMADMQGSEAAAQESAGAGGNIVKSPLVGTFYAASSEDAEPFVSVGDKVKEGQVLAIVEAMKLMNDIESDFTGTVSEILVKNGDTVEYGQPLFVIA